MQNINEKQKRISDLRAITGALRSILRTPEAPRQEATQTFEDDGYTGQFVELYRGASLYGECHYYTYARLTVTRGIDIVRHVINLNPKDITKPVESLVQHISLGPQELERLLFAHLEWSIADEEATHDQ